jgi:L-aspartate oxidase
LRWALEADVVVVGSGAAGITAALTAAGRGRRVLLLSKDGIGGGATPLAQGGLAAALGPGDTPALHQRDTLDAGAGLCDPAAVAALVAEAPGEIARLAARGARLERTMLHLEGGHSRNRIVTAGGDAIGAEVDRWPGRVASWPGWPVTTAARLAGSWPGSSARTGSCGSAR